MIWNIDETTKGRIVRFALLLFEFNGQVYVGFKRIIFYFPCQGKEKTFVIF